MLIKLENNIEKESVLNGELGTNDTVIKVESNHVYFYSGVYNKSAAELNKLLQEKSDEMLALSAKHGFARPIIYLHICSGGGSIFSGISIMDTILRLRKNIDIVTIVEGYSASAGTFISIVGTKRLITANSYMLIHQLSSGLYGTYRDLVDDMKNNEKFMKMIKDLYKKYTSVPMEIIDEILSHDLFWDASECLKMNLVDEII